MTDFTPEKIEDVAAACHEANRSYCQSIGDDSQKPWGSSPKWQRESAIHGVEAMIADPNMTPLNSHQNWMQEKLEAGWTYGEVKDAKKKTHPCLLPFDELPEEQRRKDEIFQATARDLLWPSNPPGKGSPDDIDEQMAEAEEEAEEILAEPEPPKSIRVLARELRNRVERVMAATGKRPGDLVAFSATLGEIAALDIPLMESTEE